MVSQRKKENFPKLQIIKIWLEIFKKISTNNSRTKILISILKNYLKMFKSFKSSIVIKKYSSSRWPLPWWSSPSNCWSMISRRSRRLTSETQRPSSSQSAPYPNPTRLPNRPRTQCPKRIILVSHFYPGSKRKINLLPPHRLCDIAYVLYYYLTVT